MSSSILEIITGVAPDPGERVEGQRAIKYEPSAVSKKLARLARGKGDAVFPTIPGVQSLSIATRFLNGGRDHFIELVQMAGLEGHEDAVKFLSVLAALLPGERLRANYDEVCAAAGVRPSRLVGAVTAIAMEYGADVGNLVYAASHPKVVAAGVAAALKPEGTKDREMLFQHQGFIPVPRSAQITVNASANAQAQAAAASQSTGVPSFADDIRAVGDASRVVAKQLEAARDAETIEGLVSERVTEKVTA